MCIVVKERHASVFRKKHRYCSSQTDMSDDTASKFCTKSAATISKKSVFLFPHVRNNYY